MKTTDDCQIEDGFVNYLVLSYCSFDTNLIWLAIILMVINIYNIHFLVNLDFYSDLFKAVWLFILFVGLGVTADTL